MVSTNRPRKVSTNPARSFFSWAVGWLAALSRRMGVVSWYVDRAVITRTVAWYSGGVSVRPGAVRRRRPVNSGTP